MAVSVFMAAAIGVDAMATTVAASAAAPTRRADVDESARTIITATMAIPLRNVTECVSDSTRFMPVLLKGMKTDACPAIYRTMVLAVLSYRFDAVSRINTKV